jgi:hypothetical protein
MAQWSTERSVPMNQLLAASELEPEPQTELSGSILHIVTVRDV